MLLLPHVYQAKYLRTDAVRCRESVGTALVPRKVVPVTGAASSGISTNQLFARLSFPTPPIVVQWTCVIQKKVSEA